MTVTPETLKQILEKQETVLRELNHEQRIMVLNGSIALYERDGHADVAAAIRERLKLETATPPTGNIEAVDAFEEEMTARVENLTAARIARNAPGTVAVFQPLISFEDRGGCTTEGCKDFVLGWEAGQLSARLDNKPNEWNGIYHHENRVMLERIAADRGYSVDITTSDDPTWLNATFRPLPPTPRLTLAPEPTNA